MNVSNEGMCLDMNKYLIQVVHIFRGRRGWPRCEHLLNEPRCLEQRIRSPARARTTFQKVSSRENTFHSSTNYVH
jgi:hypothetical protein